MTDGVLRVIDAGRVGPTRSQSLWHGIAAAMEPDSSPTLSFCRPARPYVGIGFHRRLDELDLEACRAERLPILRRQIGGGPVYLDSDQLFFQLTMPAGRAPAGVDRLYALLLEPAAAALRALGIDARVDGMNDIAVGDRKLSGTGAGQVGGGVTVVGNVIFRFPHERMARVLAFPREDMRAECLRLMRRYVSSLADEGFGHVDEDQAKAALRESYASALGLRPVDGALDERELAAVGRWQRRLRSREWLLGPDLPARTVRQVKVRAGVWTFAGGDDGLSVLATVVGGRFERVSVAGAGLNGAADGMSVALAGAEAEPVALAGRLERFGDHGRKLLQVLEPGLVLR